MNQPDTPTTTDGREPKMLRVGRDQVTISEDRVLIDAAAEMPDWQVREYSRIPIWFQDRKYFLRGKAPAAKPYSVQYTLAPWPADLHDNSTRSLSYDPETVAERDAAIRTGRAEDVVHACLLLIYPFLGLLWSRTKAKLPRFGFAPRSISGISIFTTFSLMILQLAYAKFLIFTSLKSGQIIIGGLLRAWTGVDALVLGPLRIGMVWLDLALFVALLADTVVRYTQHLKDVEEPWGFCEWLFCGFGRKAPQPAAEPALAPPTPMPSAPTDSTTDDLPNVA